MKTSKVKVKKEKKPTWKSMIEQDLARLESRVAALEGKVGVAGEQGKTGAKGEKGDTGETGDTGAKGDKGSGLFS